jgi:monovalent cation:H+ antiporter-2, CPA2 family
LAPASDFTVYKDALVVLGTACILVPLIQRIGVSPVLTYLGAGALLGPLALGSAVESIPPLAWVTVADTRNVAIFADLGVVFLLFLVGLELSPARLIAMRRWVIDLGGLQFVATATLLSAGLISTGLGASAAIVLAACLALSSTAIVLEVLSRQGRLTSSAGRASIAVLLAQDLAVIPILMYIAILGANQSSSVVLTVGLALLRALLAVGLIIVVGQLLLRPLFRLVARTKSHDLFVAATLFVVVATGVAAATARLSMALGAFVAGLLMAETEYRKAIEATIEPFKGLLLGIFFFTIGMRIDLREFVREPVMLLACVVGLIAFKATILAGLAHSFALPRPAVLEISLLLGPGGEFAFVGLGLAATSGIVSRSLADFALTVTSITMALIPLLGYLARRLTAHLETPHPVLPMLRETPEVRGQHAIVVGYGRVGKVVCTMLEHHGVAYIAVDHDAHTISEERGKGRSVYFGDAAQPAFLSACGLHQASAVIVTIHVQAAIDEIVRAVRDVRPEIPIISRARDAHHARHLYSLGVTDAVPETIEASLQLSEAALINLGIPTGPVIASIHEQRDVFRHDLQSAAKASGLAKSHAVRAKRSGAHRS